MRSMYKLFLTVLFCLITATSYAEVFIPERPANYVVDLAGIIDDQVEAGLNRYLLELEQKTTAQFVILTINSLEGESIEDLSIRIAHDKWKLGQKGKDNGVLLLIAVQDGRYRFEIGYGLEGILPDSLVGTIGRRYLVPYFRKGDYSTGVQKAALAVISTIASEGGVEISGMPQFRIRTTPPYGSVAHGRPSILSGIFTILFFIGLIYLFIKHPRLLLLLLMFSFMGGGRRGGWSGAGGFGGGFGGFGGGGGGGFGGGGASGGW